MMTAGSSQDDAKGRLRALLLGVGARAAGYWWLEGDRLVQRAFVGCDSLPEEVATGFAAATKSVPLDRHDLGIVKAAYAEAFAASYAKGLPPEAGSGYWLRAFGADRSIAVPIRDDEGGVRAVVSLALADGPLSDAEVSERIVAAARPWISASTA